MSVGCYKAPFPTISDNVVNVMEFELRHLTPRYVGWLNDPETVQFSEQRHSVHTIESCRRYFEAQQKSENYFLAIEKTGAEPRHIGNMGVTVDRNNQTADLSILIGERDLRGKGLGFRAWSLVMDACFRHLGFRFVTAGSMETNSPMIRVFQKSGMNIDAILPQRFLWNGREVGMVAASGHSSRITC